MRETQQSICEWADATFGTADHIPRIFSRVHEELAELIKGLTQINALAPVLYDPAGLREEAADAAIVMCRIGQKAELDHMHAVFDQPPAIGIGRTEPLPIAIHATSLLLDAMDMVVARPETINNSRSQGLLILIILDLVHICDSLGGKLAQAVDDKMTINRAREWNLDNTGHGYHR